MKKLILIGLLAVTASAGYLLSMPSALGAGGHDGPALEKMEVRLNDTHSLQAGAATFVNYCLGCHSAKYMRYNRLNEDLAIPVDLVESNMLFGETKIGDPMTTNMPADKAAVWFGVAPPDLSLVGRLRGADWLYNYLKGFYVDETAISGWNNIVFENVAMPHVLAEWQGRQRAVFGEHDGKKEFQGFELESPGSMTPEEFDTAMKDLTNFLMYMGEPAKLKRIQYGIWVIVFLMLFGVLAWALKKEYWRDVDVSH